MREEGREREGRTFATVVLEVDADGRCRSNEGCDCCESEFERHDDDDVNGLVGLNEDVSLRPHLSFIET